MTRAKCVVVQEGWAQSDLVGRLLLKLTPFPRGMSASLDENCASFPTVPESVSSFPPTTPPHLVLGKAFPSKLWPEAARWRECRPHPFHLDAHGVNAGPPLESLSCAFFPDVVKLPELHFTVLPEELSSPQK